ncbi:hypothetical protein B0H11DRAFT_2013621 [Mycena galericulata]|nr:hypothetical protein B0H11DRAFT_2013621 [Mycena galericulata]
MRVTSRRRYRFRWYLRIGGRLRRSGARYSAVPICSCWCITHGLQERTSVITTVSCPIGWVCSPPSAFSSRTLVAQSVDASSVTPSRGWVLISSPTRISRVSANTGAPRCARCARSCFEPLLIGSPGKSFPAGLVAAPVCLRAALSQSPSIVVVFIEGAAGGGAVTPSGHRALVRFRI